jgi:hypothetical protein
MLTGPFEELGRRRSTRARYAVALAFMTRRELRWVQVFDASL